MTDLDLNQFLEDVSSDLPCGEDLEYDQEFQEMERAAEGKPETQFSAAEPPDWKTAQKLALRLLTRTRDVRVATKLTFTLATTDGFAGVALGLGLIDGLLQQYWECVHPQQDSDDSYPVSRMNALAPLNDYAEFLALIRAIPLTDSRVMGKFNFRDVEVAEGHLKPIETDAEPPQKSQIDAAFLDSDLDWISQNLQAINTALTSCQSIKQATIEQVGAVYAPDLEQLIALLVEIQKVLAQQVNARGGASAEVTVDGNDPQAGAAQGVAGDTQMSISSNGINNRQDVAVAIDAICEYFDRNEPTSPVPLLLLRAKGLMTKGFMEIIEDIAPDGIKQAEEICKPDKN